MLKYKYYLVLNYVSSCSPIPDDDFTLPLQVGVIRAYTAKGASKLHKKYIKKGKYGTTSVLIPFRPITR